MAKPYLFLLYAVSGFLSLGYQVAWFRIFADGFGSTSVTFALVIASFIGGLGAGGACSAPLARRLARLARTQDPLRLYGVLELGIAATGALTLLVPAVSSVLAALFPYVLDGDLHRPSALAPLLQLWVSALCIFLPCFAMGATFPLLCTAFPDDKHFPSSLYAWNALGACTGVLACELVLLPLFGHELMLTGLLFGNLALGAIFLLARAPDAAPIAERAPERATLTAPPRIPQPVLFAVAIASGLLTGALEADVLCRLQFLDCRTGAALSCISFFAILAIALASALVRALPQLRLVHLQAAAVLAFLCYVLTWHFAYPLREWASSADLARVRQAQPPLAPGLEGSFQFFHFGYGFRALLLYTGIFVLPAFFLLSLLLPYVCNAAQAERRHVGRIYGANTLAFCAGLLAFTAVLPRVNHFYAMRAFFYVFALAVVFLAALRLSDRHVRAKAIAAGGALAALLIFTPASFAPTWFPEESPPARYGVRALRSDGAHTTFVVEEPGGDVLYFDSHAMSGCNAPAQQYMRLMAHVPLLAHPSPRAALLICFGVGNTASAIAAHDSIERLDVVDLDHQVFATASEFAAVNQSVLADPRVRRFHDDGRRFLAATRECYDLITSEPPPPMFPGVSRLYSADYYEEVRDHLTPDGLMSQWLPIDQLPLPALRAAIASFVAVFPDCFLFVGQETNYVLVGARQPLRLACIEERFSASPRAVADLERFGVATPLHLFARITRCGPTLAAEFRGFPQVRDARNNFSHLFHDPRAPSVLSYDPEALLSELGAAAGGELACRRELEHVVRHLGRLKTLVPDFPPAALRSVAKRQGGAIAMTGVDWHVVAARIRAADRELSAGRAEAGLAHLEQAFALAPEYPPLARDLGTLAVQMQRFELALRAWEALDRMEPDGIAGAYGKTYSLLHLGRASEALEVLDARMRDFPREVSLQRLRGDVLSALERWSEALGSYDRALELAPGDGPSATGRARCLERLRR